MLHKTKTKQQKQKKKHKTVKKIHPKTPHVPSSCLELWTRTRRQQLVTGPAAAVRQRRRSCLPLWTFFFKSLSQQSECTPFKEKGNLKVPENVAQLFYVLNSNDTEDHRPTWRLVWPQPAMTAVLALSPPALLVRATFPDLCCEGVHGQVRATSARAFACDLTRLSRALCASLEAEHFTPLRLRRRVYVRVQLAVIALRPTRVGAVMAAARAFDRVLARAMALTQLSLWLTTIGGAYSALGMQSVTAACSAERNAWHQVAVARAIGDRSLEARCLLHVAFSALQQGFFSQVDQTYHCSQYKNTTKKAT
jgi:hypothetical protein